MPRILDCIAPHHDLGLLVIAGLICLFGSVSTVIASRRLDGQQQGLLWPVLVTVCAASTVWATHFIAMLAYQTSVAIVYDPVQTLLSYLVGMLLMGPALVCARRCATRSTRLLCGALFGAGVAAVHYLGMAAVGAPWHLAYDARLVALSVVMGCAFGAGMITQMFGTRSALARLLAIAALAMTILSLHFIGMCAVSLSLGPSLATAGAGLSTQLLVAGTSVAAAIVLGITLLGAQFDERMTRTLQDEATRFRTLADGAFEGLIIHRGDAIIDSNAVACRLLGFETLTQARPFASLFADDLATGWSDAPVVTSMRHRTGHAIPVEINRRPILMRDNDVAELVAIRDLSAQQAAERKLAEAMESLGALRSLIPMCAWCKCIRDDEGYWGAVDKYLSQVTGNEISHGICPSCSAKELAKVRHG